MAVETSNDFLIGSNGAVAGPMLPLVCTSKQQAYRAAAYLRVVAFTLPDDGTEATAEEIYEAVMNT